MRVLIQRVSESSVSVNQQIVGQIGNGLLVFLGICESDGQEEIDFLIKKIIQLRIFDDENGVMNRSVVDIKGEILLVSQFTLYASTKKGNRPSYINAAPPSIAIPLYEKFCKDLNNNMHNSIKTGIFGAEMKVSLINDGPVTIWIDSQNKE